MLQRQECDGALDELTTLMTALRRTEIENGFFRNNLSERWEIIEATWQGRNVVLDSSGIDDW